MIPLIPAEPDGARVFDWMHLLTCTSGDSALADGLLQEFIVQCRGYLDQLAGEPDETLWRDAAHKIKGASRGIGALALAANAARIEEAPPANLADARVALEHLRHDLLALERHLR